MKIINRKFSREYEPVETYEVGIVLSGPEVKAIYEGGLRLDDSYVKIIQGEPFLINAEIPAYRFAKQPDYDPKRSRKLLLHKKELVRIQTKLRSSSGLTVVPVSCYNKGALIKLEVALAKGRTGRGKRKFEKAKTIARNQKRMIREYEKR